MAIRYYQTDPNDPMRREVWRNLSGESLEDLAEKLVDLSRGSRPEDGGGQDGGPRAKDPRAP